MDNCNSTAKAWLRALELTAAIPRNRARVMPTLLDEGACRWGEAPALLSEDETFSYTELAAHQNRYARWALESGIAKGDVVCLLMRNRPEYLAIWLGITSIGGVVALLNTNLRGPSLAHCINAVRPKGIIVAADCAVQLDGALARVTGSPLVWIHGGDWERFRRIDSEIERQDGRVLADNERRRVTIEDQALYIFTSGTTGMPKAARVSHARLLQWSYWFSGMLDVQPSDCIYNCLPMYHSIGGVLVPGAVLMSGGRSVIREKFSASQFWPDILRYECTLFQYIGELCRYLLHSTRGVDAAGHHLRLICGNGMSSEVWDEFKKKFQIPRILEFYASTEGGVSLFNVEEKRGAIGHIPPYLAHRFAPVLVRIDLDTGEPLRDGEGRCIQSAENEPGEALGRLAAEPGGIGTEFEGYTDAQESTRKILRDVIKPGDAWIRTGDMLRKDESGYYYFIDRIGDTFRWKGENVATSEVAATICRFPGVKHANVYGVTIPAAEGRAGMVALVADAGMNLPLLDQYLQARLPRYAQPLFLRLRSDLEVTGTFKYSKGDLIRQGYNPFVVSDPLYFNSRKQNGFIPLDRTLYERIQSGQVRL